MKRYLVYSLLFHIIFFSLALFLVQEKKGKGQAPFYARIVSPREPDTGVPQLRKKSGPVRVQPSGRRLPPPVSGAGRHPGDENAGIVHKETIPVPGPSISGAASGRENVSPSPAEAPLTRGASGPQTQEGQGGLSRHKSETGIAAPPKPLREKIFDRDVIGKFAHRDKEAPRPDANLTFDAKEFKYQGYLKRLRERIEGVWIYPSAAAEKGFYGDLYIQFTIKKNGRLGPVELVRTSGHKDLDDAAIRALRNAEPYWPLPDDWDREGFTVTGHFIYTLYGTYIR